MRILFLCSEYEGLIKTGGLADACRGLAQSLRAAGHEITVMLPRYGPLYQRVVTKSQSIYFDIAGRDFGCAVRHCQLDGINIAMVEHDDFFQRLRPYDDGYHGYLDNPLRFAFFCKAALEWAKQTEQQFDIIHAHDWQTAAAGYYLKQHYQNTSLGNVPFVFTIHNGAYQEVCASHWRAELDIQPQLDTPLNMLALALQHADLFNTVSQGYRDELMHEPLAAGLTALYQQRADDFRGILNGCDYSIWNPATDSYLPAHFDHSAMAGKLRCKNAVRLKYGLEKKRVPLFVAVSRLTGQKGYDYLIPALEQWLEYADVQVIVKGTGEARYCQQLAQLEYRFPTKFRFLEGFSEELAHQVEAAGDFFLMPSLFEPCGLNQLYSLRYGTVPVVRLTGGLKDTVRPYPDKNATGIGFMHATSAAVLEALNQAQKLYARRTQYSVVQQRAMQQNFSWDVAASQYEQMYQQALSKNGLKNISLAAAPAISATFA